MRDAFPDVLKGLITAEEAQDYPDEAKPKQPRDITPRNPLDLVAPPVAIPQQTSDPVVIEQAFAQDAEAEELATKQEPVEEFKQQLADAGVEVVDIPEVTYTSALGEQAVVVGFPLFVPGKAEPFSVHGSIDEWADAYEDLADKTARAGKKPPRERMTILRELRECNEATIKRVDSVKRVRHTVNYNSRLKALGAAQ